MIKRTVKFPETTVAGEPITTYATTSPGAEAYRNLAREVLAPMSRRVRLPGASELFRPTDNEDEPPAPRDRTGSGATRIGTGPARREDHRLRER